MHRQVRAFGEVLAQQAVGVFVRAALPRALRIAEVHLDVGRHSEPLVIRELDSAIPGQRLVQMVGNFFACLISALTTVCVSRLGILASIT